MEREIIEIRPEDMIKRSKLSPGSERALEKSGLAESYKAPEYESEENRLKLVGILIDDSRSIETAGNREIMIEKHNSIIDALKLTKEVADILLRTQYLNGFVLNDWNLVFDALKMDKRNYSTDNATPLYDSTVNLLGNLVVETRAAKDRGQTSQFNLLIVSDGADTSSTKNSASDVKSLVTDIFVDNHQLRPNTIAFMGLDDGETDYMKIANEMGIDDTRVNKKGEKIMQIITPNDSPTSIRRAFDTWTKWNVQSHGYYKK